MNRHGSDERMDGRMEGWKDGVLDTCDLPKQAGNEVGE
jgi:hypothetical protein